MHVRFTYYRHLSSVFFMDVQAYTHDRFIYGADVEYTKKYI